MSASHSLFPGRGHTRTTTKPLANLAPHDVIPYFTSSSSHSSRGESIFKFHLDGIIRGNYFRKKTQTPCPQCSPSIRKEIQTPKGELWRVKPLLSLVTSRCSCCTTAAASGQSRSEFPSVITFKSSSLPCMLQCYLYWFNDPLNKYCTLGSATLLRSNYSFSSFQRC